jgi:hypothetical protein
MLHGMFLKLKQTQTDDEKCSYAQHDGVLQP